MNHPFMPYRWDDGVVDHLEGSHERPAKRHSGESGSVVAELNYATVSVTWSFYVKTIPFSEVCDVLLAHPLFSTHMHMRWMPYFTYPQCLIR